MSQHTAMTDGDDFQCGRGYRGGWKYRRGRCRGRGKGRSRGRAGKTGSEGVQHERADSQDNQRGTIVGSEQAGKQHSRKTHKPQQRSRGHGRGHGRFQRKTLACTHLQPWQSSFLSLNEHLFPKQPALVLTKNTDGNTEKPPLYDAKLHNALNQTIVTETKSSSLNSLQQQQQQQQQQPLINNGPHYKTETQIDAQRQPSTLTVSQQSSRRQRARRKPAHQHNKTASNKHNSQDRSWFMVAETPKPNDQLQPDKQAHRHSRQTAAFPTSQKSSRTCFICKSESSKYRCPNCKIGYCSVACFRRHKETPCTPSAEMLEDRHNDQTRTEKLSVTEDDTVPEKLLSTLSTSTAIRYCLANPHLQSILKSISTATNPDEELRKLMGIAIFREYADACLKALGINDIAS